jgi:ABC-type lipoprotein release transport system permease subunit
MNIARLIFREIAYRKINFILAVLSVAVGTAAVIVVFSLLKKHDLETEKIVAARQAESEKQMAKLEDDLRKITLGMGFNILILPREQNLGDMYAEDFASKSMPEEYATRLAQSHAATINHILPSLTQKIQWPEMDRTILLTGVRGEVYVQSAKQKPLLEAVPEDGIVLGYELHRSLKLKMGDTVKLLGHTFTVTKLNGERGTKDDITAWINLKKAQALLNKPGQINAILALDCTCATDRLSLIRPEIARILPDTQVIEFASQALARAEARQRGAQEAQVALAAERKNRAQLRGQREQLAATLTPAMIVAVAAIIALLAWTNVQARRSEIGLYRALGMRTVQILGVFLGKGVVVGLLGALVGAVGGVVGMGAVVLSMVDLGAMVVGAVGLTLVATWLPALIAAQQDPLRILQAGQSA